MPYESAMNSPHLRRLSAASLTLAGLFVLSSCKDYDLSDNSDFAEKAMAQHYKNGEMNDYQYQNNVKVFVTPGASAPAPAPASATDKAAPTPAPAISPPTTSP